MDMVKHNLKKKVFSLKYSNSMIINCLSLSAAFFMNSSGYIIAGRIGQFLRGLEIFR